MSIILRYTFNVNMHMFVECCFYSPTDGHVYLSKFKSSPIDKVQYIYLCISDLCDNDGGIHFKWLKS